MPYTLFLKILQALILTLLASVIVFAQQKQSISGKVIDAETQESLPYASLSLQSTMTGTITNMNGEFELFYSDNQQQDTLKISFIGYEDISKPLATLQNNQVIELQPQTMSINEITITPMSAEDYILKIHENIPRNYCTTPFRTKSYYKELFKENNRYISNLQGVFLSYDHGYLSKEPNQHQLALLKQGEIDGESEFMNGWFVKQAYKQKDRSFDSPSETNLSDINGDFVNFGGPESILDFDYIKSLESFLNPEHFKDYNYEVGEITKWQDRNMIQINFETKHRVSNSKYKGYFLFDVQSYAIAAIQTEGSYTIPLLLQPILKVLGVSVESSYFLLDVKYDRFGDNWYPKDFHANIIIDIKKTRLFKENETARMVINQIYFVNEIENESAEEIPVEFRYHENKNIKHQLHPDSTVVWEGMNVLKK